MIIDGLSLGSRLWDVNTQKTALVIFSELNFSDMDEDFTDSYTQAVKRQNKVTDPHESAYMLLQAGKHLIPYLTTTSPTTVRDIHQSWDIATKNKNGEWQAVSMQARAMTAALGLMFIETLYPSKSEIDPYVTRLFQANPDISLDQIMEIVQSRQVNNGYERMLKQTQLVFLELLQGDRSNNKLGEILGIDKSTINNARNWLEEQELIVYERPVEKHESAVIFNLSDSLGKATEGVIAEVAQGRDQLSSDIAMEVLSKFSLQRMERDSWIAIRDAYIAGLQHTKASVSTDPNGQLLNVGKLLAPYIAKNVRSLGELLDALEACKTVPLKEGKAVSPEVDPRIEEIQTALTLVYIETYSQQKKSDETSYVYDLYRGNPAISTSEIMGKIKAKKIYSEADKRIRLRQLVFLYRNENIDSEEIATRLDIPMGQLRNISTNWFGWQRLPIKSRQRTSAEIQHHKELIIQALSGDLYISNSDLAARIGIDIFTFRNDLRALRKEGRLPPSGYRERRSPEVVAHRACIEQAFSGESKLQF